jgi:predicted MFS family arabinose efflux permease
LKDKRFKLGFRKPVFRALPYVIFCVAMASMLFLYKNFRYGQVNPFKEIELQNILMAKTDLVGDTYVIDSGRSRVVKMNKDGRADYEIKGGNAGDIFYNVCDLAVEDEKSFFVHEVVWDESGMSIVAERILEFDKKSGTLGRELYRLDRNTPGANRDLSALIALSALKFEGGKLWFARKGEDFFALQSLVPGEAAVMECSFGCEEALLTLGDFVIDVAEKRLFFVDKAGVIKIANFNIANFDIANANEIRHGGENKISTVFTPASGVSAREFSLPYRLTLGGESELYFSDIGKRAVMRLEGENVAKVVFGGWEEEILKGETLKGETLKDETFKGKMLPVLYSFVYGRGDLLVLTSDVSIVGVIVRAEGGEAEGYEVFRASSLPVGYRVLSLRICLWLSVLVLLLSSLLVCAALFFNFLSSEKTSGKNLLSLSIITGMVLAFIAIVPTIFNELRDTTKNEMMRRLSTIMEISSQILDVEALAEIKTPQDYNGPAYRKFTRSLRSLINRDEEWNRQIYCDVFQFKDGIRYSVCFLDGTIGAFFNPTDAENSDAQIWEERGEWIKDMNYQDVSGSYMSLRAPIYNADGSVSGGIELGVDLWALEERMRVLMKGAMVRALLTLAFLLFLVSEILESIPFAKIHSADGDEREIPLAYLRPFTFVIFLAFNLSTGFLPNYALKLGSSFMGFSPGFSAALPVIISNVALTIAPLTLSFMMMRASRRVSFFAGFVLCVAGYASSAAAVTVKSLTVGMGVLGLGAGILFTLMQICIASRKNADEKALAFSSFASASFSGINCGIMIGGMIAVTFGQKAVFSFGVFWMLSVMAAFLFVSKKKTRGRSSEAEAPRSVRVPLMFPRRIIGFLALSFFPFTLYSGFIYYLVPVFGSRSGFSDAEISLVFVFFGMGLMFLGPKIVALLRGETNKIPYFLLAALATELTGILCFASFQSAATMLAAVFILGGASGVGNAYFPLYLTEMPESQKLREGGEMTLFNFTENLGFVAGPMIFSAILHSGSSVWYYVLAASMLLASLSYQARDLFKR